MLLAVVGVLADRCVVVIECFKAVAVLFELDRRENDAHVTSVFLARTDMMRVLPECEVFNALMFCANPSVHSVDDLANYCQIRLNADIFQADATVNDILLDIQRETKSCGNSIDTYYESRFGMHIITSPHGCLR